MKIGAIESDIPLRRQGRARVEGVVSEALKRLEAAMDRLAVMAVPDTCASEVEALEQEMALALALAREEWRRDQTVKDRLARLMEAVERETDFIAGKSYGSETGMVRNLRDALREARYSEDIGYGDTIDDDIKARTR